MGWLTASLGQALQRRLGIDYLHANTLDVRDGVATGEVIPPIVDGAMKAQRLTEIAEAEGLSLEQCIAVGDGANDLPMLRLAGLGIAFRAKPLVRIDDDVCAAVEQMFDIMYAAEGIGLAAPQVALPYRVFVVNTAGRPDAGESPQASPGPAQPASPGPGGGSPGRRRGPGRPRACQPRPSPGRSTTPPAPRCWSRISSSTWSARTSCCRATWTGRCRSSSGRATDRKSTRLNSSHT